MSKKRTRRPVRKRAPRTPPTVPAGERRTNVPLREVVDELVEHVRWLSQNLNELSTDQLDYAQDRLEWLADELWRITVEGN